MDVEKEDRISELPDHIIHHILSFLPSTKQAIQTGILSKGWRNQWTQVPVLIFDYTHIDTSYDNFVKFVDDTIILHKSSKIKKFHLHHYHTNWVEKIRFATKKHVEDLSLSTILFHTELPEFLFNNASLVKLTTHGCTLVPLEGKVNWRCLKELNIKDCRFSDQAIMEQILSGSPLLESLKLSNCANKLSQLVITSKSLKSLVLEEFYESFDIEISCPKLEKLMILGEFNVRTAKFTNLPCSLCATIDICFKEEINEIDDYKRVVKDIMQQLQNVKELTIGGTGY